MQEELFRTPLLFSDNNVILCEKSLENIENNKEENKEGERERGGDKIDKYQLFKKQDFYKILDN